MATSPRAKSEARIVLMRRVAWDGRRLGLCDAQGHHGINAVVLRGQDGSGGARHPAYIALEWLQVRKEEIGRGIRRW
jgi:hypothetical protein